MSSVFRVPKDFFKGEHILCLSQGCLRLFLGNFEDIPRVHENIFLMAFREYFRGFIVFFASIS